VCFCFPSSLCSDALSIRNNISLRRLSHMHSKTSIWSTTISVFSAEIKIMALTNLSVRTKLSRPCEPPRHDSEIARNCGRRHTCAFSRPTQAVTGRGPTLPPNAFVNKQPAFLGIGACCDDRIHTTAYDRLQLSLQEGTLTPTDLALFARLAPAAVSAPLRRLFALHETGRVRK
jgi:hypothetical protein